MIEKYEIEKFVASSWFILESLTLLNRMCCTLVETVLNRFFWIEAYNRVYYFDELTFVDHICIEYFVSKREV